MNKSKIIKLVISITLPLALGALAGLFTSSSVQGWYSSLVKPTFNPPNWVFGPVWTTLYVLMGISFYLVWSQPASKKRNSGIFIFLLQLTLNFAWSFIFFYFHQIGLALIEIILLWIFIVAMILQFHKIVAIAAFINIPYLLWVSFATFLNASYYFLNNR